MLSRRLLRIKIVKALYSHFKSESDSLIVSEKNLLFSIDKTYELYHQLLWLVVDVANYAENRIELGRRKKLPTPEELNPNTRFVDNRVIAAIRDSEELTDYLQRKKLGWVQYPELIKKLYILLTDSDFNRQYMNGSTGSFKGDAALVEKFYTRIVCECEALEEVIEEQSIFWTDDVDFATIMVLRTLSDMREGRQELPLLPQYKSDDDREYVPGAFPTCAGALQRIRRIHRPLYQQLGSGADRIHGQRDHGGRDVRADRFPIDSRKGYLDEFIEIAKYYSTPGSSTFINGVLDKVVEALTAEKRIQKTGRGLLDK